MDLQSLLQDEESRRLLSLARVPAGRALIQPSASGDSGPARSPPAPAWPSGSMPSGGGDVGGVVLPPGAKILEEQCARMAQVLLRTEQAHLDELRRCIANEFDEQISEMQKGCVEAEAEFYRAMAYPDAGLSSNPSDIQWVRRDVQALAYEALELQRENWALAAGYKSVPRAQLEELLHLCERHTVGSGNSSFASTQILEVVRGLGEVLLEVEKECEALVLSVADNPGNDAQADRLRRLAEEGGLGQGPPRLPNMLGQLRAENEALREELQRIGGPTVMEALASGGNWPAVPEEDFVIADGLRRDGMKKSAAPEPAAKPVDAGEDARRDEELLDLMRRTALQSPGPVRDSGLRGGFTPTSRRM